MTYGMFRKHVSKRLITVYLFWSAWTVLGLSPGAVFAMLMKSMGLFMLPSYAYSLVAITLANGCLEAPVASLNLIAIIQYQCFSAVAN